MDQTMPRVVRLREGERRVDRTCRARRGQPADGDPGQRQADRHLQHQRPGGLVRRPADHLGGLQVHLATRSTPTRTSTTPVRLRQDRERRLDNPKMAVVTFKEPVRELWPALFGSDSRHPAVAHPRGQEPRQQMEDGYDWSGGPWIAKWQKGVERHADAEPQLVRHEADDRRRSSSRFIPDTAAEFQAFKAGEVLAIYPQPLPSAIDAIKDGVPDSQVGHQRRHAEHVEALWMNNAKFPLNCVAVRQAIAYSIDRDAIVKTLFGDLGVNTAWQSASTRRSRSEYAGHVAVRAVHAATSTRSTSLMTGDGWTKNGSGIWTKNGKTASMTIDSTADNKRRELTEQIVQQEARRQRLRAEDREQVRRPTCSADPRRPATTS